MSEFKKWMNIVEQLAPTIVNAQPTDTLFVKNEPVLISPACGGGIGRFISCTAGLCTVDVKGILMEIPVDNISRLPTEGKDPFDSPNDKMHINVLGSIDELLRDKPDPQCGDAVRIEDVYGTGIGPGIGVFMSYSTTGKEAIVSFDDQVLTVPVEQISSMVEQEAEDEFRTTGNDGALSPMSLGSHNRQPTTNDGDIVMSQQDQFSKWIKAVEEGLRDEVEVDATEPQALDVCGCQSWDCPVCYKDDDSAATALHRPLTIDDLKSAAARSPSVLVLDDEFTEDEYTTDPLPHVDNRVGDESPAAGDASEDVAELIGKIQYMQDMGLSASDKYYDPEQLIDISNPAVIKRIYDKVMGNVTESAEPTAAEFFGYADDADKDDADIEVAAIEEPSLMDSLSSIEKKIAIAKAALDRKKTGIEEEDVDSDPVDHGLRSLGNKIVNAKMKHHGKESTAMATEDDSANTPADDNTDLSSDNNMADKPDEEVMEWMQRFAARDKLVQESNTRSSATPTTVQTSVDKTTDATAPDAETLAWHERFKKLSK